MVTRARVRVRARVGLDWPDGQGVCEYFQWRSRDIQWSFERCLKGIRERHEGHMKSRFRAGLGAYEVDTRDTCAWWAIHDSVFADVTGVEAVRGIRVPHEGPSYVV